jgi:hypothetical protein
MTPVASDQEQSAEEVIGALVGEHHIYAFGERTAGRKHIKPGDWICFNASGKGVVAHAQVKTRPEHKVDPRVRHADKYPWVFELDNVSLYLDEPVVIEPALRSRLDAFAGRDAHGMWSWFVQPTRKVTEHDFDILIGERARGTSASRR